MKVVMDHMKVSVRPFVFYWAAKVLSELFPRTIVQYISELLANKASAVVRYGSRLYVFPFPCSS